MSIIKNKDDFFLITQTNYPLREEFKQLKIPYQLVDKNSFSNLTFPKSAFIIDATLMSDKGKQKLYSSFKENYFLSDLSVNWATKLLQQNSHVCGGMTLGVFSPKQSMEFFYKESFNHEYPQFMDTIKNFSTLIQRTLISIKNPGICFNYPRVISMLINEAYFVLDSQISDSKSINMCMPLGANYPLGLLDWALKIQPRIVVKILKKLHQMEPTGRYQISPRLLLHAAKDKKGIN